MSTYEDNLLAARFAALAPEPLTGDWDEVLDRAGRTRNRRRRLGPGALQSRLSWRRMTLGRRFATAVVFACAISLALLAATMLSDSPGVLERAQAALAPNGRILHMVTRQVDDRTTIGESWSLPDGSLSHFTYRDSSEALGSNCVISETTTRCWSPTLNTVDVYRHQPAPAGRTADARAAAPFQARSAGAERVPRSRPREPLGLRGGRLTPWNLFQKDRHARMRPWTLRWIATF